MPLGCKTRKALHWTDGTDRRKQDKVLERICRTLDWSSSVECVVRLLKTGMKLGGMKEQGRGNGKEGKGRGWLT
jgi:hypothetical protein